MKSKITVPIFKYLKNYISSLIIVFLSLAIVVCTLMGFGFVFKSIIDIGIREENLPILNNYILSLCALIFVFGISSFLRSYYINDLAEKIVTNIKIDIFSNLLTNDISKFENLKVSDLLTSLVSDSKQVFNLIVNFLSFFVRNFIMLIAGLIMMFCQSPLLSLVVITIVPLMLFPMLKLSKKLRGLSFAVMTRESELSNFFSETFNNIHTVFAFNQQHFISEKFNNDAADFLKISSKRLKSRALFFALAICIILLSITLIIWVGIKNIAISNLSNGQMISFIYYSIIVSSSSAGIAELVSESHSKIVAGKRFFSYLKKSPSSNMHLIKQNNSSLIKMDNVFFSYPSRNDIKILDNFSIEFPLRKFIGIVGRSGSGKTTILQLIMKFYDANSGEIIFPNFGYKDTISVSEIRSKIAYIPQTPVIFAGTIRSNIIFSYPSATAEEIEKVITITGIDEFISSLSLGLDTDVGEHGIKLSGGQKQRISIARALLFKPEILLLDEATSSLDVESEKKILLNIQDFMTDKTIISIAHKLTAIENSDIIFVIDKGKLLDKGTHKELLSKSDLYKFLSLEQTLNEG